MTTIADHPAIVEAYAELCAWLRSLSEPQADDAADELERLQSDLTTALERVKELEDVLMFYGDPETYVAIGFFPDEPCGDFIDDFDESYEHGFLYGLRPGKRARAVLQSSGGK